MNKELLKNLVESIQAQLDDIKTDLEAEGEDDPKIDKALLIRLNGDIQALVTQFKTELEKE